MNNAIKSFVKTFAVMMTVGMLVLSSAALASRLPSIDFGFGSFVTPLVKPPFESDGLRGVVIVDESARNTMTSKQIAAFEGADIRDWTDKNAKEFLVLDKDADKASMSKWAKDAWVSYEKSEGKKLPWIVLSNGKTGTSEPYPDNPADAIAMWSKYAEKK